MELRVRDGFGDEPLAGRAVPVHGGESFGKFLPPDPDPLRVAGEQLAVVRVAGVLGDQGPELGAEVQLAGRGQQGVDSLSGEELRLPRRLAAQGRGNLGVVRHAATGSGPDPGFGAGRHVAQAAVGRVLEASAPALHQQDQQVHERQAHAGDNHVLARGDRRIVDVGGVAGRGVERAVPGGETGPRRRVLVRQRVGVPHGGDHDVGAQHRAAGQPHAVTAAVAGPAEPSPVSPCSCARPVPCTGSTAYAVSWCTVTVVSGPRAATERRKNHSR